jgi:2,3-bisphosphoglycerate-independent phosphoglycerate mutase
MPPKPRNTPFVLIIRDGWGENPHPEHDRFNAVKLARTPVDDMLRRDWPWTLIRTSGEDVGLPEGTMGNSEVGHQNIGAGRVVDQESVAITKVCRSGHLHTATELVEAVHAARNAAAAVHLMGIASDAGVHGLLTHLYALVQLCRDLDQKRVVIHLFTDGRDTGPFSGLGFVRQIEEELRGLRSERFDVRIGSVMGRFYAMDRDYRWERVKQAYDCLVGHDGDRDTFRHFARSAEEAVQAYYDKPGHPSMQGDEFVTPTMLGRDLADALGSRIKDGDTVIFYNYRGDRPREIVSAFVLPDENWSDVKPSPDSGVRGFDRGPRKSVRFVTMTAYSGALAPYVRVAFPKPPKMANIAGEFWSRLGLTQFRCAETEKYPHVTFFFNDYRDEPFPGERRENPQSPKVSTYDQKPEMSAAEVRDAVLGRLAAPECEDVIVVNFANGDMVGHTGVLEAAVKACETVDACVGRIIEATLARGGSLIVTADHGNAEQMWDPATNAPHTAHTTYDVSLHVVSPEARGRGLRKGGRLADIVPTSIALMGLQKPPEMTGESLL